MPPQEHTTKSESPERRQFLELTVSHFLEAEANFLGIYDVVLEKVENEEAKRKMGEFRGDHARHVEDLEDAIEQVGGRKLLDDVRPTGLGEAFAQQIRGVEDERELMMQFLVNERFSESLYACAQHLEVPEPVVRAMSRAHQDEQRHLRWAQEHMQTR